MAGDEHRQFTLIDAMMIIAATATGLALDRAVWLDTALWSEIRFWDGSVPRDFRSLVHIGVLLSVLPAAMLTVAALALHLRQPRDRWRRVCRRPGMAACLAATSPLVIGMALVGCARLGKSDFTANLLLGYGLPLMAGGAVAAEWSLLVLNGRWRPSPSWLDRLGRLVGLLWLVSIAALGWTFTR